MRPPEFRIPEGTALGSPSADVHACRAEWLPRSEDQAWDDFVGTHPLGTICQTTKWRDVVEDTFSHIRGKALVIRAASGQIKGGSMVYTVRSWLLGNRLVCVPFGSRVDPLVFDPRDLLALIGHLDGYRRDVDARTLQVRLSKIPPPDYTAGLSVNYCLKRHYLSLDQGIDKLWSGLDSPLRRRIRMADREGVEIRRAREEKDWRVFHKIHGQTRQRLRMPVLPRRFFSALARHLKPEQWELYIAERNGKPLGVDLFLIFNGIQQGEWSGDTDEGRRISANHKMYWTAVQDAASRGCHTFCFGRTDNANLGLLKYKRSWGCIEEDMPILMTGAQAGSVKRRADIGITRRAAQRIIASTPSPLFVGFSALCYRHLG